VVDTELLLESIILCTVDNALGKLQKVWDSKSIRDNMRHDLLSDVLSAIKNGDKYGKKETVTPASKLVKFVLLIMQKHNFIGDFEQIDDRRGNKFKIKLLGNVNACGSIRPRHSVKVNDLERWERRYLPAAGFGLLILSTPKGILTHEEAKKERTGGKLLAFVY